MYYTTQGTTRGWGRAAREGSCLLARRAPERPSSLVRSPPNRRCHSSRARAPTSSKCLWGAARGACAAYLRTRLGARRASCSLTKSTLLVRVVPTVEVGAAVRSTSIRSIRYVCIVAVAVGGWARVREGGGRAEAKPCPTPPAHAARACTRAAGTTPASTSRQVWASRVEQGGEGGAGMGPCAMRPVRNEPMHTTPIAQCARCVASPCATGLGVCVRSCLR